jgi:hypothetical protein
MRGSNRAFSSCGVTAAPRPCRTIGGQPTVWPKSQAAVSLSLGLNFAFHKANYER